MPQPPGFEPHVILPKELSCFDKPKLNHSSGVSFPCLSCREWLDTLIPLSWGKRKTPAGENVTRYGNEGKEGEAHRVQFSEESQLLASLDSALAARDGIPYTPAPLALRLAACRCADKKNVCIGKPDESGLRRVHWLAHIRGKRNGWLNLSYRMSSLWRNGVLISLEVAGS